MEQRNRMDTKNVQEVTTVKKHGIRKMYFAAAAALSFAIAMGMACGYSASATSDMSRASSPVHPNKEEIAWVGSILALGALVGGLFAVTVKHLGDTMWKGTLRVLLLSRECLDIFSSARNSL